MSHFIGFIGGVILVAIIMYMGHKIDSLRRDKYKLEADLSDEARQHKWATEDLATARAKIAAFEAQRSDLIAQAENSYKAFINVSRRVI